MSDYRDPGPPGDGSGRPPSGRSAHAASVAAKHLNNASVNGRAVTVAGLRRRRSASWRLPPLDCRRRTADPWLCRCNRPRLSEKMITAGADAARHLISVGCVPLLELDVLRALYRRGGNDRQLARELYELAGGDAA
jgi:hypothetical protein